MVEPASKRTRRPSPRYSRMFTAFAAGAYLVVTGAIGYDVGYLHGFFAGGRWTDHVIWWQVTVGIALLALGAHWFRRLSEPGPVERAPRHPSLVNVGAGRTAGAELRLRQKGHRSSSAEPTR